MAEDELTRVEYVFFEVSPWEDRCVGYDLDGPIHKAVPNDAAAVLPDAFLRALDILLAQSDEAECARCGDAVGFALRDDPHTDRERLEWLPTGLAHVLDDSAPPNDETPAVALCEDCTPYIPTGGA